MYYNKENISKIEHAINFLDEVEYYDWSDDTITETELAREIQGCINELYDILEKTKKHERELYCEHNNINCSTCKHNGNQWSEWVCEMCNSEIQYGHWERN
jgi:hypothetical protein